MTAKSELSKWVLKTKIDILAVDDEDDLLNLTKTFLESIEPHFRVVTANNAVDALTLLEKQEFDVIVSDYKMHPMDGLQFLESLRKTPKKDTPFIMFTGRGREEVAIKALNLGANRYLKKGFDVHEQYEELSYAIKSLVAHTETVTSLKVTENRYRQLFDNSRNCVAVYQAVDNGKNFIVVDFNNAASKTDKIRKEDVVGKLVTEVFPGVIEFGLFKVLQEVQQTGKDQYFPTKQYKDDRINGWRDNYVYKLSSGEVVAVYNDVTPEIQLHEQLDKRLRLEKLVNTISQTFVNIQHDDLVPKIKSTLMLIIAHIGAERAYFCRFSRNHTRVEFSVEAAGPNSPLSGLSIASLALGGFGDFTEISKIIMAGKTVVIEADDAIQHHGGPIASLIAKYNVKTLTIVPLQRNQVISGVIVISALKTKNIWSDDDKSLLETVGNIYLNALELNNMNKSLSEQENLYRTLFDIVPTPLWVIDLSRIKKRLEELKQAGVTDCVQYLRDTPAEINSWIRLFSTKEKNGTALKMFPRQGESLVSPPETFVNEKNVESFRKVFEQFAEGNLHIEENVSFKIAPDKELNFLAKITVVPGCEENWERWLFLLINITPIIQSLSQLQTQKDELSQFAHLLSHDLNNSLMIIAGNAKLLETTQNQRSVVDIQNQIQYIHRLMTHALELADGGFVLKLVPDCDINKIIQDIGTKIIPPNIQFTQDKVPFPVTCDPIKVTQIFKNLFENAVLHGNPQSIMVTVSTTKAELTISVSNDGNPIPEKIANQVFNLTTSTIKGLMLVKKLVESHGWNIQLVTTPITSFKIIIPANAKQINI